MLRITRHRLKPTRIIPVRHVAFKVSDGSYGVSAGLSKNKRAGEKQAVAPKLLEADVDAAIEQEQAAQQLRDRTETHHNMKYEMTSIYGQITNPRELKSMEKQLQQKMKRDDFEGISARVSQIDEIVRNNSQFSKVRPPNKDDMLKTAKKPLEFEASQDEITNSWNTSHRYIIPKLLHNLRDAFELKAGMTIPYRSSSADRLLQLLAADKQNLQTFTEHGSSSAESVNMDESPVPTYTQNMSGEPAVHSNLVKHERHDRHYKYVLAGTATDSYGSRRETAAIKRCRQEIMKFYTRPGTRFSDLACYTESQKLLETYFFGDVEKIDTLFYLIAPSAADVTKLLVNPQGSYFMNMLLRDVAKLEYNDQALVRHHLSTLVQDVVAMMDDVLKVAEIYKADVQYGKEAEYPIFVLSDNNSKLIHTGDCKMLTALGPARKTPVNKHTAANIHLLHRYATDHEMTVEADALLHRLWSILPHIQLTGAPRSLTVIPIFKGRNPETQAELFRSLFTNQNLLSTMLDKRRNHVVCDMTKVMDRGVFLDMFIQTDVLQQIMDVVMKPRIECGEAQHVYGCNFLSTIFERMLKHGSKKQHVSVADICREKISAQAMIETCDYYAFPVLDNLIRLEDKLGRRYIVEQLSELKAQQFTEFAVSKFGSKLRYTIRDKASLTTLSCFLERAGNEMFRPEALFYNEQLDFFLTGMLQRFVREGKQDMGTIANIEQAVFNHAPQLLKYQSKILNSVQESMKRIPGKNATLEEIHIGPLRYRESLQRQELLTKLKYSIDPAQTAKDLAMMSDTVDHAKRMIRILFPKLNDFTPLRQKEYRLLHQTAANYLRELVEKFPDESAAIVASYVHVTLDSLYKGIGDRYVRSLTDCDLLCHTMDVLGSSVDTDKEMYENYVRAAITMVSDKEYVDVTDNRWIKFIVTTFKHASGAQQLEILETLGTFKHGLSQKGMYDQLIKTRSSQDIVIGMVTHCKDDAVFLNLARLITQNLPGYSRNEYAKTVIQAFIKELGERSKPAGQQAATMIDNTDAEGRPVVEVGHEITEKGLKRYRALIGILKPEMQNVPDNPNLKDVIAYLYKHAPTPLQIEMFESHFYWQHLGLDRGMVSDLAVPHNANTFLITYFALLTEDLEKYGGSSSSTFVKYRRYAKALFDFYIGGGSGRHTAGHYKGKIMSHASVVWTITGCLTFFKRYDEVLFSRAVALMFKNILGLATTKYSRHLYEALCDRESYIAVPPEELLSYFKALPDQTIKDLIENEHSCFVVQALIKNTPGAGDYILHCDRSWAAAEESVVGSNWRRSSSAPAQSYIWDRSMGPKNQSSTLPMSICAQFAIEHATVPDDSMQEPELVRQVKQGWVAAIGEPLKVFLVNGVARQQPEFLATIRQSVCQDHDSLFRFLSECSNLDTVNLVFDDESALRSFAEFAIETFGKPGFKDAATHHCKQIGPASEVLAANRIAYNLEHEYEKFFDVVERYGFAKCCERVETATVLGAICKNLESSEQAARVVNKLKSDIVTASKYRSAVYPIGELMKMLFLKNDALLVELFSKVSYSDYLELAQHKFGNNVLQGLVQYNLPNRHANFNKFLTNQEKFLLKHPHGMFLYSRLKHKSSIAHTDKLEMRRLKQAKKNTMTKRYAKGEGPTSQKTRDFLLPAKT